MSKKNSKKISKNKIIENVLNIIEKQFKKEFFGDVIPCPKEVDSEICNDADNCKQCWFNYIKFKI